MKLGLKNSSLIELYFSSKFENPGNNKFEASISKITINRTNSSQFSLTKNIFHCESMSSTDPKIEDYHFTEFDVASSRDDLYFIGSL
jgi:hypothetical protein